MNSKVYYRLDDIQQKSLITKTQLIDLALQDQIKLSVQCNSQRGLIFSVNDEKVLAHQFGFYNGFLQLSKDATQLLTEKGSHLLTVGKIEQVEQFQPNELLPKEIDQYVFDRWEVSEKLSEEKGYGFFLNVESGESVEGSIENHERYEKLSRSASFDDPKPQPFSETRGSMRDISLLGDSYSMYQLHISTTEFDKAKKLLKTNSKKDKYRKTGFTQLLAKIIKANIHFSSDQIWQVLEKEIASNEIRKYDDDMILKPNDEISIKWINAKGKETIVKYEGFASRISRLRTNENLNRH